MKEKKIKFNYKETNGIPICPYCQRPTKRTGGGGNSTLMYFPPRYDERGQNINPDRNILTFEWRCEKCGKVYRTRGNKIDGFDYI